VILFPFFPVILFPPAILPSSLQKDTPVQLYQGWPFSHPGP